MYPIDFSDHMSSERRKKEVMNEICFGLLALESVYETLWQRESCSHSVSMKPKTRWV